MFLAYAHKNVAAGFSLQPHFNNFFPLIRERVRCYIYLKYGRLLKKSNQMMFG